MNQSHGPINTGRQISSAACGDLVAPMIPLAEVLSIQSAVVTNHSVNPIYGEEYTGIVEPFCNVSLSLTHPGANDTVWVEVWLPLEGWNGRYSATGGSGLTNGAPESYLGTQLHNGYATSVTDGGLTLNNTIDAMSGDWAVKEDGSRDYALLLNFAWRSIHDATLASKDLIRQFYGKPADFSYYRGCSQGGRHGLATAAKYPEDFDGIVANAPAVFHDRFLAANAYPQVLMQHSEAPPFCIFEAFQQAIIAECDPLDGATDGLISDPDLLESCPFNCTSLVGAQISCDESNPVVITQLHAEIIKNITRGPLFPDGASIWYGNPLGADFDITANTTTLGNGTTIPSHFFLWSQYIRNFALQDREFDVSQMTLQNFTNACERSIAETGPLLGNQQYDLTAFKEAGGKLLTWTGLADNYIPPLGTARFRQSVEKQFGGPEQTDEFYRVFFAPGVGHCFGGYGPVPVDPLSVMRSWVEDGIAPDTLFANTTNSEDVAVSRNLCRYPQKITYVGGDVNLASSFTCK